MRRFRLAAVVVAILAATAVPSGQALAHAGEYHVHQSCTWFGWCYTWFHWHPHKHEASSEERRKSCEKRYETLYQKDNDRCFRYYKGVKLQHCLDEAVRNYGKCKQDCLKNG